MQTKSEIQLQLSIWRPALINRSYLFDTSQAGKEGTFAPVDKGSLLEQIYVWDAGPNDIYGACSQFVSQKIKEKLVEPFASSKLPMERTIARFRDAVNEMLIDDAVQSETDWTDSQETVKLEGNDEVNFRANLALAMLWHFHWAASVFLDVPRASVLIR